MTIQDLGSIGEFVAAIATLITLLYLAIQIRQNTRSVRSSTYQAVLDSSNRMNQLLGEPDLQRIYRLGRKDPKQLNEEDLIRFQWLLGQLLNLYEGLFLQHQQGAIDDDFFLNRFATFHHIICQPGPRAQWEASGRRYYSLSFVRRVDELLAAPPRSDSAA